MGLLNWLRTLIGHGGSDLEDDRGADVQDMMGWADTAPVDGDVNTVGARGTAATGACAVSTDAGTAGTEQARARADYECAVCGTGVYTADEQCPLCHSSDVVPVDGPDAAGARGGSDDADDPSVPSFGDQHVGEADDDSVEKLRELREGQGLLERHDDRWQPTAGGFRVETADGELTVDSREALVAALEAHEESQDEDDDQIEDVDQERPDSDDDRAEDANGDGDATRNSGADRTRENDGE